MKPADFFLGVRQLFGILLPGLLWVMCISLLIGNQDPFEQAQQFGTAQFLILLVVGYLLGITMRRIAFRTGVGCGLFLHRVLRYVREGDTFGRKRLKEARENFKQWLRDTGGENAKSEAEHKPKTLQSPEVAKVYSRYKEVAYKQLQHTYRISPDPSWGNLTEEDRAYVYKYIVLNHTDLARKVEENEAEINLYATLVLPLAFLLISLLDYWGESQNAVGVFSENYRSWWVIGILATQLAILWRVLPRRVEEAAEWYRMFIAMSLLRESPRTEADDDNATRSQESGGTGTHDAGEGGGA